MSNSSDAEAETLRVNGSLPTGLPAVGGGGGVEDPSVPAGTEAPVLPETPDVQPEVPEVPTGPDIEPPSPAPEIEPGVTPGPEIPMIPATPQPEIPYVPPAPGAPESPGGMPPAPMGIQQSV